MNAAPGQPRPDDDLHVAVTPEPPGTEPPVTGPSLLAAAAAGLVAAITVPDNRPGLGVTLAALVAVGVVLALRPARSWSLPWPSAVVGCVVAVMVLPAVSDALWVVVPAVLCAVVAFVVALGGGRSWPGVILPVLRCLPLGLRAAAAGSRALGRLAPSGAAARPALRATILTVVLVGVFGALFASADRVFGTFVRRLLLPDIRVDLALARILVLVTVAAAILTLVRLHPRPERDDEPRPATRSLVGVEWQLPLTALLVLFIAFVTLQFGVLFGGHERVLETAGLTYAEYARGGFAQLVVVAILTLAVIATTSRYTATRTEPEDRLRRWLLAGLCVLTLVVLASAFHRLNLYQAMFGFTRLRFGAQAIIWWLAGVFGLVLAVGGVRRSDVLPRAVVLFTAVVVVAVGYLQPDAFIARWNVERYATEARIDVDYLAGLSSDAVPALVELPADIGACVLEARGDRWTGEGEEPGGWAAWNRSRARATDVLGSLPQTAACRGSHG
jgi:hypothetical protein